MLALTFANEADYDKIQEDDTINFLDLTDFAPKQTPTLGVRSQGRQQGYYPLQPHL